MDKPLLKLIPQLIKTITKLSCTQTREIQNIISLFNLNLAYKINPTEFKSLYIL